MSMKDDIDPGTGNGKVHEVGEPVAFGNRIFTFKTEGGDTVNMFYRSVSHVMVPQNEAAAERSTYRRLSMVFRH
ncbi:MAG: hypothetical protein KGH72_01275 [Candidatus Micrarchaeota archaeon]|nr:hypothetical protein [Candidatus Micrarchaeota archaeon]